MYKKILATALTVFMALPMSAMAADHPTGGHMLPPAPQYMGEIKITDSTTTEKEAENAAAEAMAESQYADMMCEINYMRTINYENIAHTYAAAMENTLHTDDSSGNSEETEKTPAVRENANTNIDCVLTEDMAPMAYKSLKDAEEAFGVTACGKTMQINTKTDKITICNVKDADGVVRVAEGGEVSFIPNQNADKNSLVFMISGEAAYTPVVMD